MTEEKRAHDPRDAIIGARRRAQTNKVSLGLPTLPFPA
jgi:hypothetical protein